ncbi:MAG: hypothetical protein H8D38_04775 [DPANN group archaeon]|nr:hypothetical protein [DPANN group archaeon]
MGFLGFLKKKDKVEPAGLTPVSQHPEELKKELLGKKDIPPIEDIPLPPKQDETLTPEETPIEELEKAEGVPVPLKTEEETPAEPEKIEEVPPPPEPEEEAPTPEEKPATTEEEVKEEAPPEPSPEEKTEEFDFSLPDFTDEELKIGEEIEKPEEAAPELVEEEKPAEPTVSVEASPLLKTKPEEKEVAHYISITQCNNIFGKIDTDQTVLAETIKNIQKQEMSKRTLLANYKSFHDNLDSVQEKLMEIDSSLFER